MPLAAGDRPSEGAGKAGDGQRLRADQPDPPPGGVLTFSKGAFAAQRQASLADYATYIFQAPFCRLIRSGVRRDIAGNEGAQQPPEALSAQDVLNAAYFGGLARDGRKHFDVVGHLAVGKRRLGGIARANCQDGVPADLLYKCLSMEALQAFRRCLFTVLAGGHVIEHIDAFVKS